MQIIKGRPFYDITSYTNLRDMITRSTELYGEKTAFAYRNKPSDPIQKKSYLQFNQDYQALGTALLDLGLADQKIAIIGDNSYYWCLAHTAMLNGVGISVPLDRLLPEQEIINLLERGGVAAVFFQDSFYPIMQKAVRQLPGQIKALFSFSALASASQAKQPYTSDMAALLERGYELLGQADQSYTSRQIDENSLASLLFTSGTTSAAKAVMLSHKNICADIAGLSGIIKLEPGTRLLSVLPLHHTFENTCGLFVALSFGCEIDICDGLRYIQKNLNEYKTNMIIGVPAVFESFYNKVQLALKKSGKDKLVRRLIPLTNLLRKVGLDLRQKIYGEIMAAFGGQLRLGICGAAPIDTAIISFFDAVGLRILQGYGLTETAPVVAGCNDRDFKPGTVGSPIAGVEVAIDAKKGQPGEILVRGPIVMLGYYEDEAATAEVIDQDGWFRTGDIGMICPRSGFLTITGRLKSMIVLKNGKKVYPEEIEFMINQKKFIKESLVWGEEGKTGDVYVNAKIVIDRDQIEEKGIKSSDDAALKLQLDQIIADINRHLPSFKKIRNYVYSFQDMVKTTTRKVRRPIEIANIQNRFARLKLTWQELSGKNFDQLQESSNE